LNKELPKQERVSLKAFETGVVNRRDSWEKWRVTWQTIHPRQNVNDVEAMEDEWGVGLEEKASSWKKMEAHVQSTKWRSKKHRVEEVRGLSYVPVGWILKVVVVENQFLNFLEQLHDFHFVHSSILLFLKQN
jgi:hypothetical protein